METIDFGNINKNIANRESEIRNLRQQFGPLISVNTDLQVVIDSAEEKVAREILQKIATLKILNEQDSAFRDRALAILKEHNIPLWFGSSHPEGHIDFGMLRTNLHNQIQGQIKSLKARFLANELTSAAYESEVKSTSKPLEDRIAELEAISAELGKFAAVPERVDDTE